MLAISLGASACGGSDDSTNLPAIPAGAVAALGDQVIGKPALRRQVAALRRAQGSGTRLSADQLRDQALVTLLQAAWLEQEAKDRGVVVPNSEVMGRWKAATGQQFKSKRGLRRFLGDQKRADLLFQLRVQLLTAALEQKIGQQDGTKATTQFQKDFQTRWQDSAACAKGYAVPGCKPSQPR